MNTPKKTAIARMHHNYKPSQADLLALFGDAQARIAAVHAAAAHIEASLASNNSTPCDADSTPCDADSVFTSNTIAN